MKRSERDKMTRIDAGLYRYEGTRGKPSWLAQIEGGSGSRPYFTLGPCAAMSEEEARSLRRFLKALAMIGVPIDYLRSINRKGRLPLLCRSLSRLIEAMQEEDL